MAKRRGPGDGGLYQRSSDGRWIGVIEAGYAPNGKRIRKTVSASTRREARDKLDALRSTLALDVDDGSLTIEDWLKRWMHKRVDGICADSTVRGYWTEINAHIVPYIGRTRLGSIKSRDVQDMLDALRESGLSSTTMLHAYRVLSRALKIAVVEGRIAVNPCDRVEAPRLSGERHEAHTPSEAARVIAAARTPVERLRLVVALRLGVRQGEALGLEWASVHADGDEGPWVLLHQVVQRDRVTRKLVVREGLKGSRADRLVTRAVVLLPEVAEAFAGVPSDQRRGLVFGGSGPVAPETDHDRWKQACRRAGVRELPLHGARAAAEGWMTDQGLPPRIIADILGHKHVRTTEAHYHRVQLEAMRAAVSRAGL